MINKRNKRILDASRISNYNKFLSTLDNTRKKCDYNPIFITKFDVMNNEKISNTDEKISKNDNKKENDVKKVIDNLIDKINNNFSINEYSSKKITGQTIHDILLYNMDTYNPNIYENTLFEPNPKSVEPIEYITIDVEINNIDDILKLVNTYKIKHGVKYNINMKALHDIKEPLEELNNMIGMNCLKTNIVDQILYFVQELHKNKNSKGDFMHTVIFGPPGTGKTEIAKIMGKIYSKIGLLKNGTFKKVTRSDLIAGYLGQTALKTKEVITEALGGVLFIDEAYALGNSEKRDSFSKECIDTLCEALSDNKENLMVIIAGYEKELKDCFFNYNQGLDSRFTWRFKTDDYSHEDLYNIFIKKVKDIGWEIIDNNEITVEWFRKNKEYLIFYGRDIETILAKTKIAHSKRVFCKPENEKKKINLSDLNKGFEIFINNNDIKNKINEDYKKRQIYNSLYC
jgi:SpoVK/Ycf46/Vps4 family AAA+-type ATPase